jgi:FixJ family two-component response regulator
MAALTQTVVIIEDDTGMNSALERVLRLAGIRVEAFVSAKEHLMSGGAARVDCLVRDISAPRSPGPFYVDCKEMKQ